jgi:hypothetical protein
MNMRHSILNSEVWTTPPNISDKIDDFEENPNKPKYLLKAPVANVVFGIILSVSFLIAKEIYAPEVTEPIIHPVLKIKMDFVNLLISAPFWAQTALAVSKVIHNLNHNYLVDIKKIQRFKSR